MTSDTSWFYAMKCTDVDALACTGRSVSKIPPSHMVCMGRAHMRVGRASVFRERWWEDWDNSAEPKCGSALGAGLPAGLMGVGSGKRDAIRGPGRATRMRVSLVQQTRFSVSRCLSSSLQSCASLPTHVRTHIASVSHPPTDGRNPRLIYTGDAGQHTPLIGRYCSRVTYHPSPSCRPSLLQHPRTRYQLHTPPRLHFRIRVAAPL